MTVSKGVSAATLKSAGVYSIYGRKYEDGEWKSGTNRELEEMNKGENIVELIKGQRISWLGHLERMEEGRMHKISSLKNWKGREEGEDKRSFQTCSRTRSPRRILLGLLNPLRWDR